MIEKNSQRSFQLHSSLIAKNVNLIEQNQRHFWNKQNYRQSAEKL